MLYRGYVLTKGKRCIEKLKDRTDFKTLDEVRDADSYAGVLAEDTVMIDVDDPHQADRLMDLVEFKQLNCTVIETKRGKHFLFRNNGTITQNYTHVNLAMGITADIKIGSKTSYEVLKINGVERFICWDYGESPVPKWLNPIRCGINFSELGEGDGRNSTLFSYILVLQRAGYSVDEAREAINYLNDYVLQEPLPPEELNTVLRDDAFSQPIFFNDKGKFLFNEFGDWLIREYTMVQINNRIHQFNEGVYISDYGLIERNMLKAIPNLTKQQRNEVLAYIDVMVNPVEVSDAKYIAFNNGVLNIETGELGAYSNSIILVNKIPHDYVPHAYNDTVDTVLNRLSCNDKEIRNLLCEMAGYLLYRRNELRKFFILVGDKSNGKSTYINMLEQMLGKENTSALSLADLSHEYKSADLLNSMANLGDDIDDEWIKDTSILKKIVSGDKINVNKKFEQPFEFAPTCKLIFSANAIPRLGKAKGFGAIKDRLIIVPFNATFKKGGADYDPYIKYKLRSEDAMEYLIALAVEGLKSVLANQSFTVSGKVEAELVEYEHINNPALGFMEEYEHFLTAPINDVYNAYVYDCNENQTKALSRNLFTRMVKEKLGYVAEVKWINGKSVRMFVKGV